MSENKLIFEKCFINGKWITSNDNETFSVINPSNGETIGKVPLCSTDETKLAIDQANIAFKNWSEVLASIRSKCLQAWYDLIIEHQESLAKIMTLEMGKPITESRGEILYAASFVEWFSQEALRVYGDVLPSHAEGKQGLVFKQPIGVVGAITPWNFPSSMITRKLAPALAAGCSVIVKPAENTPFSALALAHLAKEAGFPDGVVNVITGNSEKIGAELTSNPKVKKISFTGSTMVGKKLMSQSAQTVKKVSLELGGNAPFIVFNDADLDLALQGLLISKFRNTGQTCVCANRIYFQDEIYDKMLSALISAVKQLKMSDGLAEDCKLGPLVNKKAYDKVSSLVDDALAKGAKVEFSADKNNLGECFYPATILSNVKPDMDIFSEEIFGPIACIYKFSKVDEVIKAANATPFGLAAYFYSSNINLSFRVAKELEYGMIGINDGIISHASAPFGGVKESGIGREGSKYGLDDFLEIKFCSFGNLNGHT